MSPPPRPPAALRHEANRAVLEHWWSLRRGGDLPSRDRLDPAGIVELIPALALLNREDDGRWLVRLAGTRMVEVIGREITGGEFQQILLGDWRPVLNDLFDRLLLGPMGAVIELPVASTKGNRHVLEVLALPMRDREGRPRTMLLSSYARPAVARFDSFGGHLSIAGPPLITELPLS